MFYHSLIYIIATDQIKSYMLVSETPDSIPAKILSKEAV